ncbi:hypothetical protein V7024_16720 [Bacillus sp. JJ864]|uniref:hypothetical protein n=1 Tax=Bacillus sp. JJ864 TaxID=3122975 RepID=UPI002FFEBF73
MTFEDVIEALKLNSAKVVGDEIGIGEKGLLKVLKNVGYKHNKKGGVGWYYAGTEEPPLKKDIQEFIPKPIAKTSGNGTKTKKTKKESENNSLTTHDMKLLRELIKDLGTIKKVIDSFADKYHLNAEDVIELALHDFFAIHNSDDKAR